MTEVPTVGDTVATRVRRYRRAQGISVRALAERCAALGMPQLTVGSLSNIERGQDPAAKRGRREVTVDELMTLALALAVPPLLLLTPLGETDSLQIAPGRVVHPAAAVDWIAPAWYRTPLHEMFGATPVVDLNAAPHAATSRPLRLFQDMAHVIDMALYWRVSWDRARAEYRDISEKLHDLQQQAHTLSTHYRSAVERWDAVQRERFTEMTREAETAVAKANERVMEAQDQIAMLRSRLESVNEQRQEATRRYAAALDGLHKLVDDINDLGLQVPPIPTSLQVDLEEVELHHKGDLFDRRNSEGHKNAG